MIRLLAIALWLASSAYAYGQTVQSYAGGSGAGVAASQSGTWTVQPGNTANTTAWLINVGAINGVTPLMGNGVTGTGSQRVTIASDNTAFSVNANAGTNLNTSLLALESGGNLASVVTQLGAVAVSPTANTVQDRLKTLNTTLGSPFQAGASIGNASFGVSGTLPAYAAIPAFKVDQTTPGTTNLVALAANQSVNVAQMNGVATTMGNGIAGTGVQRVAIASDNTAFPVNATLSAETTKVIGTVNQGTSPWVISGTLTANQSVNAAQFGGTNVSTGAGAGGAGIPRVTISNDSSLAANQSVNHAQVAGVATSTNTGVAGTGTQRVTLSNTDPCASPDIAKSSKAISVTSAATTSLVAVSGSTTVYVCGYSFTIAPSATSADTAAFEYGTGAACTSPTLLTGTYGNGDLTSAAPVTHVTYGGAFTAFKSASSAGICILTAGTAVNVQGVLTYIQQ